MIWILYILATLWSAGTFTGIMYFSINEIADSWWGRLLSGGVGLCIAFFIAVIPWAGIIYINGEDLVTLKKDGWECKASHTNTSYIMSGNVLVPIINTECDLYGRR